MELLCEFDLEIKHVKGKENYKVVDALSGKFHVEVVSVCKTNLKARVLEALANNEFYIQVKGELQKEQRSKKYEGY